MESNQTALAVVDAAFSDLERKIAELDQLSDKLQTSKELLAELADEITQIKTDANSLDRTRRISRLSSLNSASELAAADDSALVVKIVIAKGHVLDSGGWRET